MLSEVDRQQLFGARRDKEAEATGAEARGEARSTGVVHGEPEWLVEAEIVLARTAKAVSGSDGVQARLVVTEGEGLVGTARLFADNGQREADARGRGATPRQSGGRQRRQQRLKRQLLRGASELREQQVQERFNRFREWHLRKVEAARMARLRQRRRRGVNPFPDLTVVRRSGYCGGRGSKFYTNNTRFFCVGRLNGCLGPNYVPGTSCLDVPSARGSPSPTGSLTLRRDDGRDGVTGVARPLRTSNRRSCVVR